MATFGWVEPEDFFVTHLADRDRAFWLDGAGSRPWSGQLSYIGWLEPADLSLTFHAASRSVTAHQRGQQRRAGVDIFAELRQQAAADRAAGDPGRWVGFFGYASRSNLAAQVDPDPEAVDACWLRAMRIVEFDHDRQVVRAVAAPGMLRSWAAQVGEMVESTGPAGPPVIADRAEVVATCDAPEFAAAFARVQAELRLGNSYETNLTFQTRVTSDTEPLDAYRRL
ncbi:MAG: hypothetical protein H0U28_01945, partial [Nocardioidaceae bacterium]|nr:hypothetical protein [Nocardioidaceae bacterium]